MPYFPEKKLILQLLEIHSDSQGPHTREVRERGNNARNRRQKPGYFREAMIAASQA